MHCIGPVLHIKPAHHLAIASNLADARGLNIPNRMRHV
jgi:hypothetical protein